MEIYTNSRAADRSVSLRFPADEVTGLTVDIAVYQNGEHIRDLDEVAVAPNAVLDAVLPLSLVQHDGRFDLRWTISYLEDGTQVTINRQSIVDVVTPILSPEEILEVWDTASPSEIVRIERAVRHIIQAYTGQEFGYFIGEHKVKSIGGSLLRLPRRLMFIDSFQGAPANASHFLISDGGYTLSHFPWGVPPVKADYHGLHMHTGGVIHNPNNVRWQQFQAGSTYTVAGHWGWEAVPEPVREAARLLVNDYACADSQYRDRYLTSMTAADWRIQFNSGAFMRTGNVRADQLLSEFVTTRGWGVI